MLSVRMDPAGPKDQKVFSSRPFVYPFDAVETPWRHLGLERLVSGIKSLWRLLKIKIEEKIGPLVDWAGQ